MIEETISLKDMVSGPAQGMLSSLTDLEGGLSKAISGFEGGGESAQGMGGAMDALLPELGLAVGAIGAVVVALGALVVAGAGLALQQSQLKQQTLATFSALGGGAEQGKATLNMLDQLSEKLGTTREALVPAAKAFMAMGVTDLSKLQADLTASASAAALMGDSGASAYESLQRKIQGATIAHQGLKIEARQLDSQLTSTGANINDVAAVMGVSAGTLRNQLKAGTVDASKFGDALNEALTKKGAGPLQNLAGSMGNQLARFKENIGKLFEDVDPGPFLSGLKDLLHVFDQSTESGKALKFLVTGFFNGLFSIAGKVFPYVKKFFLELVIVGLKFYISLRPAIDAIKKLFATSGEGGGLMTMLLGYVDLIGDIWQGIGTVISYLFEFLAAGKQVIGAFIDGFSGIGQVVENLIEGLVSGITGGIGRVVDAAKNLAKGAMDAIKGALGIHSPSKVAMMLGGHFTAGFAGGISANDNAVSQAAGGVAEQAIQPQSYQAAGKSAQAAPSVETSKGGGASIMVNVQIDGAGKTAHEITEEMVSTVFERIALAEGY